MDGRVCKKCNEWKSAENFHKHAKCKGGINTVCKECRKPLSTAQWANTSHEYKIWSRCKSRANQKGLDFNIDIEDIIIPDVCPIFKTAFQKSGRYTASLDRIDPTKGYIKGNIRVISNRANVLKSNATLWEMEQILKDLRSR